ncbi:junctional adhesion molecule A-like isoform X1 [Mauremys mutica]|uniref:junctional adhesion molecule A-like isoform X1 n=1 Tax=Mauremys mutica TaxID=74926 RepID=UPI001D16E13F|nr:junctional adhesion molecule A-like isoform X1 [Mauremys mutica]
MAGPGAWGRIHLLLLSVSAWSLISAQVVDTQTIQVPENDPIEIPCSAYVLQSGTARVEWKFEKGSSIALVYYDAKVTDPYKDRVTYTPTGLRFSSVTQKDTGKYVCEVLLWTGSGDTSQLRKSEVDLIVQEPDGSPPPTCQCYRDNVLMTSNAKINKKFRNSCSAIDTKTGVLMNEPVTSFDTGDYFCEAQNNVGTSQKSEAIHLEAKNVISYKDMKVLVDSGNARIIDVRLPEEVANGRIANSVNIPVAEVEEALKMDPETFKMKYGIDKPRMDDENLIFYCQRGRRAAEATKIAIALGYTKARNYAGSYKEWSEKEGN